MCTGQRYEINWTKRGTFGRGVEAALTIPTGKNFFLEISSKFLFISYKRILATEVKKIIGSHSIHEKVAYIIGLSAFTCFQPKHQLLVNINLIVPPSENSLRHSVQVKQVVTSGNNRENSSITLLNRAT